MNRAAVQPARLKLILNDKWNRPEWGTLRKCDYTIVWNIENDQDGGFSLEAGHHIEPGSVQPVTQPDSSAMVKCPEGKWNHSCFKGTVPQLISHTYICAQPWIIRIRTQIKASFQILFLCLFIRKKTKRMPINEIKQNHSPFHMSLTVNEWTSSPNLTLPWQQQIHTLQVALCSTRIAQDLSWDITNTIILYIHRKWPMRSSNLHLNSSFWKILA